MKTPNQDNTNLCKKTSGYTYLHEVIIKWDTDVWGAESKKLKLSSFTKLPFLNQNNQFGMTCKAELFW